MRYHILPTSVTREQYNEVVHHPLQSWEWGEARKAMGTEIIRFGGYLQDELVEAYLMTIHPIPHTPYKIGYIPRSYILPSTLLDFLKEFARSNKIIFIKFEPDSNMSDVANQAITDLKKTYNIRRSAHPLFPDWTMELGLVLSEEELLANLKSKTRYNIRLAAKKGVVIKEMNTEEGFEIFAKLYFDTTKRQHYFGHNKSYHRTIWENLKGSLATILIAWYENTPLAAYELFLFKNKLYYPYGGSSEEYRNLMGANLLMWEAIRYGKKHHAETFDMWGASAPNAEDGNIFGGFTRFKEGYNAQYVEKIGSYDFIINQHAYSLYSITHRLRNWYLNLRGI